jgi:hypothetical protein
VDLDGTRGREIFGGGWFGEVCHMGEEIDQRGWFGDICSGHGGAGVVEGWVKHSRRTKALITKMLELVA